MARQKLAQAKFSAYMALHNKKKQEPYIKSSRQHAALDYKRCGESSFRATVLGDWDYGKQWIKHSYIQVCNNYIG